MDDCIDAKEYAFTLNYISYIITIIILDLLGATI